MRLFWSNQRMDNQPTIAPAQPPSQHQDKILVARIILHAGEGIASRAFGGNFCEALLVKSACRFLWIPPNNIPAESDRQTPSLGILAFGNKDWITYAANFNSVARQQIPIKLARHVATWLASSRERLAP